MFGFSRKKEPECPINVELRLWLENSFLWLATQFGHHNIKSKPTVLPTQDFFPINYDGSKESLFKTAEIVARQMEINMHDVNLDIYNESIQEFQGGFGSSIFTQYDPSSLNKPAAGIYFGTNEHGRYDVFIEKKNLIDPQFLVAVLSHEFSHIKILGEKRLKEND